VITPIPVGRNSTAGQQGTGGFKILEGVSTRDDLGPPADHQPSLLKRFASSGDVIGVVLAGWRHETNRLSS
jgi:hypothetical protein